MKDESNSGQKQLPVRRHLGLQLLALLGRTATGTGRPAVRLAHLAAPCQSLRFIQCAGRDPKRRTLPQRGGYVGRGLIWGYTQCRELPLPALPILQVCPPDLSCVLRRMQLSPAAALEDFPQLHQFPQCSLQPLGSHRLWEEPVPSRECQE